MAYGSTVTLYVSKGPEIKTVSVPAVVGSDLDSAKSAITKAVLKLETLRIVMIPEQRELFWR